MQISFAAVALENFDMSLGNGLGKIAGRVFRIGHLGDFNDLMLMGTLSGVEMSLDLAGVPHSNGGVDGRHGQASRNRFPVSELIFETAGVYRHPDP